MMCKKLQIQQGAAHLNRTRPMKDVVSGHGDCAIVFCKFQSSPENERPTLQLTFSHSL